MPHGRIFMAAVVAGIALGSLTAVAASSLYELDNDTTTTQLSGGSSGWYTTVGPSGGTDYQAIYEVSMWEDGDSPCRLQMKSRHLNTYVGKNDTFDESQCNENSNTKKTISFSNSETYVRGVRVCLNNAGTRVKGLRLYGTKLDRNTGALNHLSGYKGWSRPNCNTWKTIRYCPPGKVATRIGIEYRAQQFIGDEVQGLKLQCRTVSAKP